MRAHPGFHCTACHGTGDGGYCSASPDGEHHSVTQLGQGYPNDALGAPCSCAKRGRGRPRTVERRVPIGFPADLLADLEASAERAGSTLTAEVIRRCRAAG